MLKLNWPPVDEILLMPGAESALTTREKICVALNGAGPLAETFSAKLFVEFACVTSGRKLNKPLLVFSVALAGPASSAKVRVCGGESLSVALAVKATVWPTFTVWLAIGAKIGGVLSWADGINRLTMV